MINDDEIARKLYAEGIGSTGMTEGVYVGNMAQLVRLLFFRNFKVDSVLDFYEALKNSEYSESFTAKIDWFQRLDLDVVTTRTRQLMLRSYLKLTIIDLSLVALPGIFLIALMLPSWLPNPEAAKLQEDSYWLIGLAVFAVIVQSLRIIRDLYVVAVCLIFKPS